MVAMISVLTADDLLEYGETFIGSLSRFTEETPVASILKSSYKGKPAYIFGLTVRNS